MGYLELLQKRAESLVLPSTDRPWQEIPPSAAAVHRRASIVAPAPSASDFVIASYRVPRGFSATITDILCLYIGAVPPIEGDTTTLFYRLRVNSAFFVKDFGQIVTTLGSLTNGPYPVPCGIRLAAGSLLELLGNIPVGSPVATGGTNRLHGHLIGYEWPATPIRPGSGRGQATAY